MDKPSPRFRQDLVVSSTEDDGVFYADVSDPQTGTKFRFYDFEYQLALQLNGQSVGDVIGWAASAYGAELTAEGIDEFSGRLRELGFLEAKPENSAQPTEITDQGSSAEAEWMSAQGAQTAQFTPDFAMLSSPDRTPVAPELPVLEALANAERTPAPSDVSPPAAVAVAAPAAPPLPGLPDAARAAPAEAKPAAPTDVTPPPPTPPASVAVTRPREAPTVRLPPDARSLPVTRPTAAPTVPLLPSAIEVGPTQTRPAAPTDATPPPNPPGHGPGGKRWAMELEGAMEGGKPGDETPPPRSDAKPPGAVFLPPVRPGAPLRATPVPVGSTERRQPPAPDLVSMTPFSEDKPALGSQKRPMIIASVLLVVLAIALIAYFAVGRGGARTPQALRVRVLSPKPAAVYRWFTGQGVVVEDAPRTLAFDAPGRVVELWPPGTEFGTRDVVGRLHAAAGVETLLAHHRSRLAFYEQMRDSMRAAGNAPEARQADLKLADKQRLVDDTNAGLARVVLRPTEPGEVLEVLTKVGTVVRAGTPVVRVKGRLLRGEFELSRLEMESATELGLCRVEVVGLGPRASNAQPRRTTEIVSDSGSPEAQNVPRFVDCRAPGRAAGKPTRLTVALPADVGLVPGQPLRLARQRFDGVFPVPAHAVIREGARRMVFIATPAGVAEKREVVVAEAGEEGGDTLISGGLRVGDQVMLEFPTDLKAGAPVVAERW